MTFGLPHPEWFQNRTSPGNTLRVLGVRVEGQQQE